MTHDQQPAEAVEAVRAVVREVLDRAGDDAEATWARARRRRAARAGRPRGRRAARASACAEVGVLLRETGARAVQLPVWETLCCGVLTLAAAGSDEQQRGAAARRRRRRDAADARAARGRPDAPHDVRRRHGHRPQDRRHLRRPGRRGCSSRPPSRDGHRRRAGRPAGPGVELRESMSSLGTPQHTVVLDGAPAELLPGAGAARLLRELATAGLCLTAAGVVAGARDLTATTSRAGPSSAARWRSSRPSRCRSRTSTSPRAPSTSAAENAAWRVADGARRRGRPRGGGVLGLPRGARRDAHLPPPARRHGRRHHLPDVALLLLDHRHRPRARRARRRTCGSRTRPPRTSSSPSRSGRSRPSSGPTSPAWPTTNEHRDMALDRHGETYQRVVRQMGERRLDGRRLAEGVRRARARRDRADDLRQRGAARRRAPAGRDAADGRADADPLRHREAEGPVPHADPRRRRALRDRLLRARRRHRPGLAAHHRAARTATTTSSTGRSSGPPAATRPTTSGSRCAPTRTPPSTRASRS